MRLTIAQPRTFACLLIAFALPIGGLQAQGTRVDDDDLFAHRSWHLEFGGEVAIETWNYNPSHETMLGAWQGFTYGLRKGLAVKGSWPLYYVDQRGTDAVLIGATIGVRGRLLGGVRRAVFWEFDVGISKADTFTPPGGTRFNYLALGAVGLSTRVTARIHLLTSLRWVHLSNNGLAGRSRNPDIEAVGPHVGVLLGF